MVDPLSISVWAAVTTTGVSAISSLIKLVKKHAEHSEPKAKVYINMPDGQKIRLELSADEASALSRTHEKITPSAQV